MAIILVFLLGYGFALPEKWLHPCIHIDELMSTSVALQAYEGPLGMHLHIIHVGNDGARPCLHISVHVYVYI